MRGLKNVNTLFLCFQRILLILTCSHGFAHGFPHTDLLIDLLMSICSDVFAHLLTSSILRSFISLPRNTSSILKINLPPIVNNSTTASNNPCCNLSRFPDANDYKYTISSSLTGCHDLLITVLGHCDYSDILSIPLASPSFSKAIKSTLPWNLHRSFQKLTITAIDSTHGYQAHQQGILLDERNSSAWNSGSANSCPTQCTRLYFY